MTTSAIATVLLTTLPSGCSPSSPHGTPAVTTTATASRGAGGSPNAPLPWHVVPSTANSGDGGLSLYGVACPGVHECWTVGMDGSANTALIEHHTGQSWSIVPVGITSPTPGTRSSLSAVTCVDADDCWAVGYVPAYSPLRTQALIEQFS